MLGAGGTSPNSQGYGPARTVGDFHTPRLLRFSALPREGYVHGTALRAAKKNHLQPQARASLARDAKQRARLRLLTPGPLRSAEKRRSRGVWKRSTVRGAYRAPSSNASPRLRASQGTPQSGARSMGVLSLAYFSLHKQREVGPAEGVPSSHPERNNAKRVSAPEHPPQQQQQHQQRPPPPLTPPRKGEGDCPALPLQAPPPRGEGLGRGAASRISRSLLTRTTAY